MPREPLPPVWGSDRIKKDKVLKGRGSPKKTACDVMFPIGKAAAWETGVDLTLNDGGRYKSLQVNNLTRQL